MRTQQFLGTGLRAWQGVTLGYFSNAFRFSAPAKIPRSLAAETGAKNPVKTTTSERKADKKAPRALVRGSLSSIRDVRTRPGQEAFSAMVHTHIAARRGSAAHPYQRRNYAISPPTSSTLYVSPLCLDAGQGSHQRKPGSKTRSRGVHLRQSCPPAECAHRMPLAS